MSESPPESPPLVIRRRMFSPLLLIALLAPLALIAWYVDDWSRDFTTNTAATSADTTDPRLRPVELDATPEQAEAALERFAEQRSNWRLVDDLTLPNDSPLPQQLQNEPAATHHFTRTTGVFRFVDDIWLVVEPLDGGGVRLHADSRSRLGRGDLGQNPRNLRELLLALAETASE